MRRLFPLRLALGLCLALAWLWAAQAEVVGQAKKDDKAKEDPLKVEKPKGELPAQGDAASDPSAAGTDPTTKPAKPEPQPATRPANGRLLAGSTS